MNEPDAEFSARPIPMPSRLHCACAEQSGRFSITGVLYKEEPGKPPVMCATLHARNPTTPP